MTGKVRRMGITHWSKTECPPEWILAKRPGALSNAHLLAILLIIGPRDSSAVRVAIGLLD